MPSRRIRVSPMASVSPSITLSKCSKKHAPWYVIPANHKWFRNAAISQIIVDTLEEFDMKLPEPRYDLSKLQIE